MKMLALCLTLIIVQTQLTNGSPQICSFSVSRSSAITGNIDVQVQVSMPDPVCIRCGYVDGITVAFVTDTENVTYSTGGNEIVNTTDISVTNDGLILYDPGNTFSDGTSIVCTFNQPGIGQVSRTITVEHLINNPPTLNLDGGDDKTVNVTKSSNITLTCTRDSENAPGDLYQWIHPNGLMTPGTPTDSPVQLTLNSITREESGMYICQGSRNGVTLSALNNNVTLNVQYPAKVLSIHPNNCTLAVNTTLVLNCTFVSNPTPINILWTHNGTALSPESNPNLSQTDADIYSLLEVDFISINSSGQYECIVNNSFGIDQTGSTFITVQADPSTQAELQISSSTNTSVTLSWTFSLNGKAKIAGVDISYTAIANFNPPHSNSTSITDGEQNPFTIYGLQPLTTYRFNVTVRSVYCDQNEKSSTVTITADTLPLVPNAPVLVSVTALSSNVLQVNWTASINPFTQTPIKHIKIHYSEVGKSTINTLRVEDGSATSAVVRGLSPDIRYQLRVSSINSAGESSLSNTIEQRAIIIEVISPTTGTVVEGEPVLLLCNLNTGGGAPEVTWKFNGMDLPMSAHVDGYTLIIINTQLSDAGNYTCFSRAGTPDETSFTFSLSVMPRPIAPIPPSFPIFNDSLCSELEVEVISPTTGTVVEGETVVLLCNLNTGGGAPDVTWKFNGMDLPMSAHADGYTLTITNPQLSDAGNYTCFSRAGTPNEASFTFSLSVMPRPTAPIPSSSPILDDSPCSSQYLRYQRYEILEKTSTKPLPRIDEENDDCSSISLKELQEPSTDNKLAYGEQELPHAYLKTDTDHEPMYESPAL